MRIDSIGMHDRINARTKSASDIRMSTRESVHIPGILTALDLHQIPHRIVAAQSEENHEFSGWIERTFPFAGSQIDWTKVATHQCSEWSGLDDLVQKFTEFARMMEQRSLVFVTWANALSPGLELELGDVTRIAREIFEEHETSIDVLVFNPEEGWLIETHHEGTLCMGRTSPQA